MNESTPPPEPHSGQGMDYSEIADVQDVHAAVQREKREPRVGREPLSIWLIGVAGQCPPLAGSEFTTGGSRRPAMIVMKVLQGPVTVKGQKFGAAVMQPWDKTLTDQKIADVLTYERSEWGNNASPVTAEQIAALRKELANHPNSFTEPDILAVPAEEDLPGGAPAGGKPPKPGEAAKPGEPPKPKG